MSVVGLLAVVTTGALLAADLRPFPAPSEPEQISGPYASLLASSTDLGPAHAEHVQLTAALQGSSQPALLMGWARQQGLSVRWRTGDSWAIVEGEPAAVAGAFDVDVHDYRGMRGQVFYASPQQPAVPAERAARSPNWAASSVTPRTGSPGRRCCRWRCPTRA